MTFSFIPPKSKYKKGFTLIELLIVVSIIAILSSFGIGAFVLGIQRAKVAKAQGDLNRIVKAIRQLEIDTTMTAAFLNYDPITFCTTGGYNDEVLIRKISDGSGLYSATIPNGAYANWKGPYLDSDMVDPWGKPYIYDGDYHCGNTVASKKAKGCEPYQSHTPSDTLQAVYSQGKKSFVDLTSNSIYDDDNIVLVLCEP